MLDTQNVSAIFKLIIGWEMNKRIRFALQFFTVIILTGYFSLPLMALENQASSSAPLIFSEVKVRNDASGYDEYIELYNNSPNELPLSEYQIHYFNVTNPALTQQPVKIAIDENMLEAGRSFVLAKNVSQIPDAKALSLGLADSGGRLKLVNSAGEILDEIAWTSTASQAISPIVLVTSTSADKAITHPVDPDNKPILALQPILSVPSPHSDILLVPPVEDPDEDAEPIEEPNVVYPAVELSELFIDPVSPQTDGNDEFVEVFNPNSTELDLAGYVIKTGSNLQYSYTIGKVVLGAGEYRAFYARDGNITLSNSGGQAEVRAPDGSIASETAAYDEAEPGQSWSKIENTWQWTTMVTPAAINIASPGVGGGTTSPAPSNTSSASSKLYPRLEITELLVDPAPPGLDSQNEYVEIYNPNPQAVNLKGYILRTGSSLKTKYNLPETLLQPGEYLALYGKDANISLSNNGGSARLDDINEHVIAEVNNYEKAEAGDAWAVFESRWQWTSTPTPNAPNVYTVSIKETKKVKAAAAKNTKATKSAQSKALDAITKPAAVPTSPVTIGVIATTAGLAVVYGLYEFRYDLYNRVEVFKRYVKNRWHSGP